MSNILDNTYRYILIQNIYATLLFANFYIVDIFF